MKKEERNIDMTNSNFYTIIAINIGYSTFNNNNFHTIGNVEIGEASGSPINKDVTKANEVTKDVHHSTNVNVESQTIEYATNPAKLKEDLNKAKDEIKDVTKALDNSIHDPGDDNRNFFGQLRETRLSETVENIAGERLKVASTQNEIKSAFEEAYSDLGYKAEIKFSTPEETPELKDKAGTAYVSSTGVHTMIININAKENSTKSRLIGIISEEGSHIINGSKGRQRETGTEEKGLESTGRATNSYFQDKYKDDKTTISMKSDGAIDTSKLGTNVGDKLLIKKSNFENLKNDLGEFMDYKYAIENCKSNFCASEKFDGSSREEIREYIKQAKKVGALEAVSLPNYETESQLNQITENIYNQYSVNNSCPKLVNQKDIKEFYGYYYLEKQENNINNEKNRLKSVCANDICFSKEEFEATFIKEQNIRKEAGQNNRKSYKFRYAR